MFVPWVLLSGTVAPTAGPRRPDFPLLMVSVRPASAAWLPRALEVSADRYGPIGVAFTYLAWLYVAAFCFMGAAVVGQVIATDRGRLGDWIRGNPPRSRVERSRQWRMRTRPAARRWRPPADPVSHEARSRHSARPSV